MESPFIFVACKFGYEGECKAEVLANCPHLRFAYSRPGFLTFKVAQGSPDFSILNRMTFVRTSGLNLSKIKLENEAIPESAIAELEQTLENTRVDQLHFWSRHLGSPENELDSRANNDAQEGEAEIVARLAEKFNGRLNRRARNNEQVLDLIHVNPGEIWTAIHKVESPQQSWPGGVIQFSRPENLVSRAYLKTKEAMIWSRFPIRPDEVCVEFGCSPGGSVQALLETQREVIGIDPADVDPEIAAIPAFTHIKKRGAEVKKKRLNKAKWLFADSNVAPEFTLDMVEDIATNQHVHLKGMILTLKLLNQGLAKEISNYRSRVQKMGFQYVRTRQLAFNRNEICLAALKRKSLLRFGKQSRTPARNPEASESGEK